MCDALDTQLVGADAGSDDEAALLGADGAQAQAAWLVASTALSWWFQGGLFLVEVLIHNLWPGVVDGAMFATGRHLAPRCAIQWSVDAQRSFDQGSYQHAAFHGKRALKHLPKAAPSHIRSTALYTLARSLEAAHGDEATDESARRLREAADLGHPMAQAYVAEQLESERPADARIWYQRSIEATAAYRAAFEGNHGHAWEASVLGPAAAEWYLKGKWSATTGFAQRKLGVLMLTGAGSAGGQRDYPAASALFEAAALAGDADGAFNLGRMYEWRQATIATPSAALAEGSSTRPRLAAEAAPPSAPQVQHEAGSVTAAAEATAQSSTAGTGTAELAASSAEAIPTPDPAAAETVRIRATTAEEAKVLAEEEFRRTAAYWYGVSVVRGGGVAPRYHLARLMLERGHPGDAAVACLHFLIAAEEGDADSQWELYTMLRDGKGCGRDTEAANRWLSAAAKAGQPAAIDTVAHKYLTLQPGGGAVATTGDVVSIAYAGFFADPASAGRPPFDQGNDLRFTIGAGAVVDGMEQLVHGMAEGEVARLSIPSHLAYGAKGHPPVIPPNADLVFEVRLNAIAQKEQVVPNPNAHLMVPQTAATTAPLPPQPAPMDEAELQRLRIQKMHEAKLQFAAPLGRTTFRY